MRARVRRWLPSLALAAVLGCDHQGGGIDRHVEDLVTIDQGIYGQVTSVNDVGAPDTAYVPAFPVSVFPVPDGIVLGSPIASAETGPDRGFYQVALDAGDWVVCDWARRCVTASVGPAQRLRLDYEIGPGPGWSNGTPWTPPQP